MQRCPNIARAHEELGWRPVVELDDGLRRTIAYFERLLRRPAESPASADIVALGA